MFDAKKWVYGRFDVKNAGQDELAICCPMCSDKRFRLYICTDKNKITKSKKMYPCWCHNEQQAYSLANIYSVIENVHIMAAIDLVEGKNEDAAYSEFDDILKEMFDENKEKEELENNLPIMLPKNYVPLYGISKDTWVKNVHPYILKRNVTYEMCQRYQLGYTLKSEDRWSDRLIIPIYLDKELATYQGRAMYETKEMKYRFKKIQKNGLTIGDCLYGIDNTDPKNRSVILVEGVFDVWAMKNAGYNNTIASFGKHITDKGLERIYRKFDKIYILWDIDAKEEIKKLIDRIYGYIDIYQVTLEGKDPDESSTEAIHKAISSSVKVDTYYSLNNISEMTI